MAKIYYQKKEPFTPAQMFELVNDIKHYPEFIPDCIDANIINIEDNWVSAYIEVEKFGFRKRFSTCNTLHYPHTIELNLLNGPFRFLKGSWQFHSLEDNTTEVEFSLEFEFNNKLLDLTFSTIFKEIMQNMVEAFSRRAHEVYRIN